MLKYFLHNMRILKWKAIYFTTSTIHNIRVVKHTLIWKFKAFQYWIRFNYLTNVKNLLGWHRKLGILVQTSPAPIKFTIIPTASLKEVHLPKISIVTPSFNQGGFIERTIQSILNQAYENLEYFIQDGGSKDNTVSILIKYENKLSGWNSKSDNGQSEAINTGFKKTTGEIMCWLNSDDLMAPNVLNFVSQFFLNNPDVDVIYGNRVLINPNDELIGRWILPEHDNEVLSWADFIPQETLFWRRSIWDKAGGYVDENFQFAMDWDLLLRFRAVGATFARIPYVMGLFRVHNLQKSSDQIHSLGKHEMAILRKRNLGYVPTDIEIENNISHYINRHLWADFSWWVKEKSDLICLKKKVTNRWL